MFPEVLNNMVLELEYITPIQFRSLCNKLLKYTSDIEVFNIDGKFLLKLNGLKYSHYSKIKELIGFYTYIKILSKFEAKKEVLTC